MIQRSGLYMVLQDQELLPDQRWILNDEVVCWKQRYRPAGQMLWKWKMRGGEITFTQTACSALQLAHLQQFCRLLSLGLVERETGMVFSQSSYSNSNPAHYFLLPQYLRFDPLRIDSGWKPPHSADLVNEGLCLNYLHQGRFSYKIFFILSLSP